MSTLLTRAFWDDTVERTVSSAAQGFLTGGGLSGTGLATGVVTTDVRYLPVWAALGASGAMALQTFLKCLAALKAGNTGTASFSHSVELRTVQREPEQDMVVPPKPSRHAKPE